MSDRITNKEIREGLGACRERTRGPWHFDSYSRACSQPLTRQHADWGAQFETDEELDAATGEPAQTVCWVPASTGDLAVGRQARDGDGIPHQHEVLGGVPEGARRIVKGTAKLDHRGGAKPDQLRDGVLTLKAAVGTG